MKEKSFLFFCLVLGVGCIAGAKTVNLPFDQYVDVESLKMTGEPSPSPAVPLDKYLSGLTADCREFKIRMEKWHDQKANISDELYHEIRTMPYALTMLEKFEVTIVLPGISNKNLNSNIADRFILSEVQSNLKLAFGPSSLTPEKYRAGSELEVEFTTAFIGGGSAIKFKTRDVFCDVFSGRAELSLSGELSMVPTEIFRQSLHKKLMPYAEAFTTVNDLSSKDFYRAAMFGAVLFNLQGKPDLSDWRKEVEKNFNYLFTKEAFRPDPQWFMYFDDRVVVRNLEYIPLGLHEIKLKIGGYREK